MFFLETGIFLWFVKLFLFLGKDRDPQNEQLAAVRTRGSVRVYSGGAGQYLEPGPHFLESLDVMCSGYRLAYRYFLKTCT